MMFSRHKFLGASLRSFSSSIGWNGGSSSSLQAQLVEDPADGDSFSPVSVGTPAYFSFGAFRFDGLLQKWERRNGPDGLPLFEVVCTDPRDVLDGAQVVLSGYNGPVSGVHNVFNAYGFWESRGFGQSQSSDAGMPWARVRDAVLALANQPFHTPFGGPLTYRGVQYGLDLSQLPQPPEHYRLGAQVSVGLLDLVAQICEDGGHDFFLELDGLRVRVRTVSRRAQPPLGTITALAETNTGTVARSSSGLEARNETTSALLVGGAVTALMTSSDLRSFWGYDAAGAPVLGRQERHDLDDDQFYGVLEASADDQEQFFRFQAGRWRAPKGRAWPALPLYMTTGPTARGEIIKLAERSGDRFRVERGAFGTTPTRHDEGTRWRLLHWSLTVDAMGLYMGPDADLLGVLTYPCNTLELRCARANFESWSTYVFQYKREVARRLELEPVFANMGGVGKVFKPNVVNDAAAAAAGAAEDAIAGDRMARQMRMYEFVKGYADEYYGRRWAVAVPDVSVRLDPDTQKLAYSHEVTDAGYLPEGAAPLGLSAENEDVFQVQDGRFRAFALFSDLSRADLSLVSPAARVVETAGLFVEAQPDPLFAFLGTQALVVLTLAGPLTEEAAGHVGDFDLVRAMLQMSPAQARAVLEKGHHGNVPLKVAPAAKRPSSAAVPLKSNALTYGPWYFAGAPGKTRFEQDPTLVPWNYGGYAGMERAAAARLAESVSSMNVSEAGQLELSGPPTVSLGDTLQSGGPNVTNVQIAYGQQGVVTTYSFQTYSPRFGVFTRGMGERMRRLAQNATEMRRAARMAARDRASRADAMEGAARAARVFNQNAPKARKKESPHDVLVCYCDYEDAPVLADPATELPASGWVRVGVSTATFEEAVGLANADSDAYRATSVASLSALVRPVSTGPGGSGMPALLAPASGFDGPLSRSGLDHFGGPNDVEVLSHGVAYSGMHAWRDGFDPAAARVPALRGPLVLAGWGYGVDGAAVTDHPDYRRRQDLWKAGPVDLLWDERRAVWTCHDGLAGVTAAEVPASGAGAAHMRVHADGGPTDWWLSVHNWGDDPVPSGARVLALFEPLGRRWYVSPGAGAGPQGPPGSGLGPTDVVVVSGVSLGGPAVGDGVLSLGTSGTPHRTELASGPRADDVRLVLPSGDAGPGRVLGVAQAGGGVVVTEWVSQAVQAASGLTLGGPVDGLGVLSLAGPFAGATRLASQARDYDATLLFPSGDPPPGAALAATAVSGTEVRLGWVAGGAWPSSVPSASGFLAGGPDATGLYGMRSPGGSGALWMGSQARAGDLTLLFGSGSPAAGQTLSVTSVTGGVAVLSFLDGLAASPSGTAEFEYVSSVTCSGSTLTVNYGKLWFSGGLLTAHSGGV